MNVEIIVDDQTLDLNDFVKKITFNISHALVVSLSGVPDYSKVEIKIEK